MSVSDMRQYVANGQLGPAAAGEQIVLLAEQQPRLALEAEHIALRQRYVRLKIRRTTPTRVVRGYGCSTRCRPVDEHAISHTTRQATGRGRSFNRRSADPYVQNIGAQGTVRAAAFAPVPLNQSDLGPSSLVACITSE
jgi:hypothetical protein